MPARREFTPEQLVARLEERRRQNREAQQRFRARHKHHAEGLSITDKHDAAPENGAHPSFVSITPSAPPDPPFSPALSTREPLLADPPELLDVDLEMIAGILGRYADRGYEHKPDSLRRVLKRCPDVDPVVVAEKLADWLLEPRNRKERCSFRRFSNWMRSEQEGRPAKTPDAHPANSAPRGVVTNGTYHAPITRQHNRQPDAPRLLEGELLPISEADFQRTVAERRAIPLPERLAALKGGKK